MSQKATTKPHNKKRRGRAETVTPIGNEAAHSLTSKSLAKKRRIASRLSPMILEI